MKTKNFYFAMSLMACLMVSCSNDDFTYNEQQEVNSAEVETSMKMNFNSSIMHFDANTTTRAADTWTWSDGAVVYLQFHNGSSVVRGYAIYSSATDNWEASWIGSIGTSDKCEIYFFEGASTADKHSVTLNANQAVYADKSGAYIVSGSEITIQASLSPQTSRIRFSGKSYLNFEVKGITFITGYDADKNQFETSDAGFSGQVGSDGYTPYFYCVFSNSQRQLSIYSSADNYAVKFVKSFDTSVLRIGESGVLSIPTEDKNRGWDTVNTPGDLCIDGNHPHAIDMGDGLKWSCCNVGANSPIEYGDYFAWGETATKSTYDWSNYKYCKGSYNTLTKYCYSTSYGTVDNKKQLELTDDVARAKWGDSWRIPTAGEQSTLDSKCTWTRTNIGGVYGYKVTAKNGNAIFLPAAAYRDGANLSHNYYGYYWSSSLHMEAPLWAICLVLDRYDNKHGTNNGYHRCDGMSVRPVKE